MTAASNPNTVIYQLSQRGLLHLADAVCARRGVTRDELCGHRRTQEVAAAPHELWWLIRHHPERCYSYVEIARIVGCPTPPSCTAWLLIRGPSYLCPHPRRHPTPRLTSARARNPQPPPMRHHAPDAFENAP